MAQPARLLAGQVCAALCSELGRQIQHLKSVTNEDFQEQLGATDRSLAVAFRRVEALRRFSQLHRPSVVEPFQFGAVFRQWNPSTDGAVLGFGGEEDLPLVGDRDQLVVALDLITKHARSQGMRPFELRAHAQTDPPNLLLVSPEEDRAPWPLTLGFGLDIDADALADRWASATQGGRVHYRSPDTLELALRGDTDWAHGDEAFVEAEKSFFRAEQTMRPWRNVVETAESGYHAMEEGGALYATLLQRALGHIHGAQECLEPVA